MYIKELHKYLPAIWLVFGGSYLNHENAPNTLPDFREQSLLELLYCYLKKECSEDNTLNLSEILKLLGIWIKDLEFIYKIRASSDKHLLTLELANYFLKRIQTFENCTVIPNGLISAKHKGNFESVNLAVLKKHAHGIDWIQIDPGSTYHQHCTTLAAEKSCSYLEIKAINPENITSNWLYLLVGLKAISPGGGYYKDLSLYECLLAQLNGETHFKVEPNEYFVPSSHASPSHTWQVIEQSFCYLLEHFLGESYRDIYKKLIVGFKLFLLEATLEIYKEAAYPLKEQCHYLLQEMCSHIAAFTLTHGNQMQVESSLELINTVKLALKEASQLAYQEKNANSQLDKPQIHSLCFSPPSLPNYTSSASDATRSALQSDPWFTLPEITDGKQVLVYLKHLKNNFIDKLIRSNQMEEIALLSHGIEAFFIDYLSHTKILEKSDQPFSDVDAELANNLIELAEIYYACQARMVKNFLSGFTYQPQFYAKNLTIQFFTYAAIAALNFRNTNIGTLLPNYNLSTEAGENLEFNQLVPYLIIDDARWLSPLFAIKDFFNSVNGKETLFSSKKFSYEFKCKIGNHAEDDDVEVNFSYTLLKKYSAEYANFIQDYRELKAENFNKKWVELAYGEVYLPSLYRSLSKVAFIAKAALKGFNINPGDNQLEMKWSYSPDYQNHWNGYSTVYHYWESKLEFKINYYSARKSIDTQQFTAYVLKQTSLKFRCLTEDPYQRLIIAQDKIHQKNPHLLENEIIASQQKKPTAMDRIQYLHVGFVQAEPLLKLERLYIAIKQRQLNFTSEQDAILIKQTLFEISQIFQTTKGDISLLERTACDNPQLVHHLGLLCVEKALGMRFRLTQHQAIAEVLEVSLAMLTFYPSELKAVFIESINKIFSMLEEVLKQPQSHLNELTLLHLNAYLIISTEVKQTLTETEMFSVLTALMKIQRYNVDGFNLTNSLLLKVHQACFKLRLFFDEQLEKNTHLLNDLMLSIIPDWDLTSKWLKSTPRLLFTCGDFAIDPLQGKISFKNNPIAGLPNNITSHTLFKDYFGAIKFAVLPSSQELHGSHVPCYLSVVRSPTVRLTLAGKLLLIEEWTGDHYERYLPAKKLLNAAHPTLLYQEPCTQNTWSHWQNQTEILIKNKNREVVYWWDLKENRIFSLQHEAYIVPLAQLSDCFFKTLIQRIELAGWIEITAQAPVEDLAIEILSLHLPRLGLSFAYQKAQFFSGQIHGYYLANQQIINTLTGFSQYLVLEKLESGSLHKQIKIIIPHRKINIQGAFFDSTIALDLSAVQSSGYFVYELDQKLGLLKAKSINAQLYLALLYYCSATLDDYDLSSCNAYHLARENLELCWKDQPYNAHELDIIEQLLDIKCMRDRHKNRVAIYLKVVSLLESSLRLGFLYNDVLTLENKKRSSQLLEDCATQLPDLFAIYLQNQSSIYSRIKLGKEEERDVVVHLFHKPHAYTTQFQAYQKLNFSECSSVTLTKYSKKTYKYEYGLLFNSNNCVATNFLATFQANMEYLVFSPSSDVLDFSKGIDGILTQRFRLENFISLYRLAQSTLPRYIDKYRYLLHNMVLRAKVFKDRFPTELIHLLARALLIVAENPNKFPSPPAWFNSSNLTFDLNKRCVDRDEVQKKFPNLTWGNNETYENACRKDKSDNENIFSLLKRYDLDATGVPLKLPTDQSYFSLEYERYFYPSSSKKDTVRKFYLQAAINDAMYQFFDRVFTLCNQLKHGFSKRWEVSPFVNQDISLTFTADELLEEPQKNSIDLTNLTIPQENPLDLTEFFVVKKLPAKKMDFPFAKQLKEEGRGYDSTFYAELNDSWENYIAEYQLTYEWLTETSINQLEVSLKIEEGKANDRTHTLWLQILEKFNSRTKNIANPVFALRCHSGEAPQYHYGDILALLINPKNLVNYNPELTGQATVILQDLLCFITHQINAVKIRRVLSLLQQYKQTKRELEKFSLLQRLVNTLQETIDPAAYTKPHWLLFQLEHNLIVRGNQRELILAMLNQNEKAMYQLNMGEGKSSVILSLLIYDLADANQLLRVNVLHALLMTMQNLLHQHFSGLIKKRIYMLPFYRDTDISIENLRFIFQALNTC